MQPRRTIRSLMAHLRGLVARRRLDTPHREAHRRLAALLTLVLALVALHLGRVHGRDLWHTPCTAGGECCVRSAVARAGTV